MSWIAEVVDLPENLSIEALEQAFVGIGFEVEEIEVTGGDITGPLVVGEVREIEELEGHKKPIRYVALDCGEAATRYVVCGARNFAVGDRVVVALPGAVLPGDFAIAARETYGRTSNGMICSARELGMGDDHTGIIVLNPTQAAVGTDAIELLQLKDTVVDVAVNPDRGYALSLRGIAREFAISTGATYRDPAAIDYLAGISATGGVAVSPIIEDETGADRIIVRTIDKVDVSAPTPLWMSRRLEKCGMRSISIAVDITNYVMLELGQALHAFDAAKIDGSLRVKRAGATTTFTTLDGQERKLSPDNLMIADDSKLLALAGTMGGLESEVTESTTAIALEAAHFDAITIAKNARFHKLSSEASRRFERGVDPAIAEVASRRATSLLIELAGARLVDVKSAETVPLSSLARTIDFNPANISSLVGYSYSDDQIVQSLEAIGGSVLKQATDSWSFAVPTWRHDLVHTADLTEEVARVQGFDLIPSTLPLGKSAATLNPLQRRKRAVGQMLANLGFSEVYNYPFVSPEMVKTLGFVGPRAASFRLANPISEEFPLLRTHLLPGLLTSLQRNLSRGAKDVAIFEIGSVFRDVGERAKATVVATGERPTDAQIANIYATVPDQPLFVGAVVSGSLDRTGWWGTGRQATWSDAIAYAQRIVEATGSVGEVVQSDLAPWHPGRCAEIQVDGKPVAHAGELHPRVLEELGLPPRTIAFAVILSALPFADAISAPKIWTFPAATQDIALIVDTTVPAAQVEAALVTGAGELLESISLFDRFEGAAIGEGKVSLAFTMTFRASDRTLTAAEVSQYREDAAAQALKECGALPRV